MASIVNYICNKVEGWNRCSQSTEQKVSREKDDDTAFKVYIYDEEYKKIQAWVSEYQNIETGGDLFGLWLDDTTAVVQLVLGPGQKCKRTSASFFQDLDYLKQVGDLLTNEEGLCHIGEWHSHHTLGLTRPSGGDENTVWSNMGRYKLHRFFLFIATINDPKSHDVGVKCFLFDATNQPAAHQYSVRQWSHWNVPEGSFQFMKGGSPFRSKLKGQLEKGAEVPKPRGDLRFKETRSKKSDESKKAVQLSVSDRQGNKVTSKSSKPSGSDKQGSKQTKPDPKAVHPSAPDVKAKPNSYSMPESIPNAKMDKNTRKHENKK